MNLVLSEQKNVESWILLYVWGFNAEASRTTLSSDHLKKYTEKGPIIQIIIIIYIFFILFHTFLYNLFVYLIEQYFFSFLGPYFLWFKLLNMINLHCKHTDILLDLIRQVFLFDSLFCRFFSPELLHWIHLLLSIHNVSSCAQLTI